MTVTKTELLGTVVHMEPAVPGPGRFRRDSEIPQTHVQTTNGKYSFAREAWMALGQKVRLIEEEGQVYLIGPA